MKYLRVAVALIVAVPMLVLVMIPWASACYLWAIAEDARDGYDVGSDYPPGLAWPVLVACRLFPSRRKA